MLRFESILFVILGAAGMLAMALLVVIGPTAIRFLVTLQPEFGILWRTLIWWRLTIATGLLVAALLFAHLWLPAGRRSLLQILPGIVITLCMWLAAGIAFGRYLDDFSQTYVTTYAGLATGMIALVFLYWAATIFLFGAELNAAITHELTLMEKDRQDAEEQKSKDRAST